MSSTQSVSGTLTGASSGHNSNAPFEGFTTMVQQRVNDLGAFVDHYSPLPIEWLLITLPFVIGIVRVVAPMLSDCAKEFYQRMQQVVIRDITAVFALGYATKGVPKDRNALLQNAIFMYLQRHVWAREPLSANAWRNKTAVVLLLDPSRSRIFEYSGSPFAMGSESDSDSDGDMDIAVCGVTRSKKFLERLLLIKLPLGTWVKADKASGVEISFRRCATTQGRMASSERTLSLMARGRDASRRIDQFTQKSLSYFLTQLPNLSRRERFFFELQPSSERFGDEKTLLFKRYVLSDDKNMDTLFFPERNNMLKLVDDFVFRRGRFSVEGFPYKLGVLLHGPPGSGKTAFVKALAAYTGRHIVSVPLGLVETNQQLYDIFLTRRYTCVGESEIQQLKLEDVIFLFDDVDAASPLVCARQRRRTVYRRPDAVLRSHGRLLPGFAEDPNHTGTKNAPTRDGGEHDDEADGPQGPEGEEQEGGEEALEERVVELTEGAKTGGRTGFSDFGIGPSTDSMLPPSTGADHGAVSPAPAVIGGSGIGGKKSLFGMFESADKLDMSGLLNVLDGVVDTPGRIVVMVTNHPERLDPALVRPGRMSSRLRLDYARFDAVAKMAGLHFGAREPPVMTSAEILDRLEEWALAEAQRREGQALTLNRSASSGAVGGEKKSMRHHDIAASDALAAQRAASLNAADDDDDDNVVENTISLTDTMKKSTKKNDDVNDKEPIRGTIPKTASVPTGMAVARVPHRQLSDEQVQQLREAIAEVEKESAAAHTAKPHAVGSGDDPHRTAPATAYRFKIAPSEIELLCGQTDTLPEFLAALQRLMRGELQL